MPPLPPPRRGDGAFPSALPQVRIGDSAARRRANPLSRRTPISRRTPADAVLLRFPVPKNQRAAAIAAALVVSGHRKGGRLIPAAGSDAESDGARGSAMAAAGAPGRRAPEGPPSPLPDSAWPAPFRERPTRARGRTAAEPPRAPRGSPVPAERPPAAGAPAAWAADPAARRSLSVPPQADGCRDGDTTASGATRAPAPRPSHAAAAEGPRPEARSRDRASSRAASLS